MEALSPATLLAAWEAGRQQHELDRALTLLAAASPGVTRQELAVLSIGQRDARLLRLRELTLGPRANAFTECPQCGEQVEFSLDTAELTQAPREISESYELKMNGSSIRFRLPNSRDLAEAVGAADENEGLRRLLGRCLLDALSPNESLIGEIGQAILAHDPPAEVTLALTCPSCEHEWETLFDVAPFFWKEVVALARRLLREIDCLARAYGWSEGEILKLSPQRRASYLEMIAA